MRERESHVWSNTVHTTLSYSLRARRNNIQYNIRISIKGRLDPLFFFKKEREREEIFYITFYHPSSHTSSCSIYWWSSSSFLVWPFLSLHFLFFLIPHTFPYTPNNFLWWRMERETKFFGFLSFRSQHLLLLLPITSSSIHRTFSAFIIITNSSSLGKNSHQEREREKCRIFFETYKAIEYTEHKRHNLISTLEKGGIFSNLVKMIV